ncbi:helix-turn-helix domain-containing protein [Spirillospora sp. NPDC048911]|uniref:helix-turn-helix domain-containing protein n=1 Tax=Spirillospora sp. NPDC048911 TaxID=3364527 RepID=UPI0037213D62
MAVDQGPVVQSAMLRSDLVRIRRDKSLTQEQVADELEWSPSKLIRVEGGRSSITKVDLDALLTLYGVTSESQREKLHALNRGARAPAWWNEFKGESPLTYLNYVGYEAGAAFIRQFQTSVVPGLLQTREYSEAQTAALISEARVGAAVNLRMRRREEMAKRSTPPRRYFVVDEAVIRRHVGKSRDPAIMPAQLRHIADLVEQDDRLTFRIIPFEAGEHPGLTGPFTLLEFEGGLSDMLYLDTGREISMIMGDDPQIGEFAANFESLLEVALSAEGSRELLLTAAEEMS